MTRGSGSRRKCSTPASARANAYGSFGTSTSKGIRTAFSRVVAACRVRTRFGRTIRVETCEGFTEGGTAGAVPPDGSTVL